MKANIRKTLQIYWKNTTGKRVVFALAFFSLMGANIVGMIIPLYFKKFFDILSSGSDKASVFPALITVLLTIGCFELLRWFFYRFGFFFNIRTETSISIKLSNLCFQYLHKHSFAYFNNNFVGTLVKRVNYFIRAFENIWDRILWSFLPLITDAIIIMFVLFKRQPILAFTMAGWIVIFLIINWFVSKYKMPFDLKRSEAESAATGILADTITNNANIKLFVGYDREVRSYADATDKVRKLRVKTWSMDAWFDAIQDFMGVVLEIALFYIAIRLWSEGKITLGDFALIQSYVLFLLYQIWNIGKVIRYTFTDLTDAAEMTEALSTPHEIQDIPNAKPLKISEGKIVFDKASFNYHETRKIIENLNLTINPHEKVAFVGPSGAGKTTLIKLLLRMHDLTSGSIAIDGQKINEITQESLWENISLVPQDPILFHRSLLENIRYGKPNATDEEVMEAAKLAHCHEFISEFPDKYNTFVGERGMKLSGGERQRVAIARAILRNAPILVLDEATSSLDSESEALIQDALNHLMKNKTVIVIAHRLSTIMSMDRIVVLDHGTVVEDGTHAELTQKVGGVYQQLWQRQAGGFITETETLDEFLNENTSDEDDDEEKAVEMSTGNPHRK